MHWIHDFQMDRYFRGRATGRAAERVLGRLAGCADCRARYERHLLLEAALPGGDARASDRLWSAIEQSAGVASPPPQKRASRSIVFAAASVAAAAAAVLVVAPRFRGAAPGSAEPVARGPATARTAAPALFIYRSVAPHRSEPVAGAVRAGDGLLLAYSNPGPDLRFLMVFAVDGAGRVYWYHPAYEREGQNPAAVPIRTEAFGVELGDEIHHALAPGPLTMYALFLPQPRSVLEVEALVARDRAHLSVPGAAVVAVPLEVKP